MKDEEYQGRKRSSRQDNDSSQKKRRKTTSSDFLNGMTVAISTLANHEDDDDDATTNKNKKSCDLYSYRQVSDSCRDAGARVSGQVHKKVECLLCTPAAVSQATQRVRKAVKNKVPLVHVAWLYQCIDQRKKLSFDKHRLVMSEPSNNDDKKKPKDSTSCAQDESTTINPIHPPSEDAQEEPIPDAGWSEPVDVGCCCVCHETGTADTCEWCTECPQATTAEEQKDEPNIPHSGWSDPVDVGCCCVCHETDTTDTCEWCEDCPQATTTTTTTKGNQQKDKQNIPDSGWSDPVDVGCCCVCHETGTAGTCEWCKDCPQATTAKGSGSSQQKEEPNIPNSGWSDPVDVGCCCVCHEAGTADTCEWCKDCPQATTAKGSGSSQQKEEPNIRHSGWSDPVDVGCCCVCHETGTTDTCQWCTDCKTS
ncbi:expressed unknown protein [Seminavis robusta]|uniref:BRCT domain-containing protein n=1 Tax=Seminavis robusta TaxID=568900 RepID=A0A9N8EXR6_9STRA|nr:expressed unknown protein [Seminavis robusta]|eukprot:Sro2102_g314590.1 n/a (422) ;mRNA; f:1139-2404